MTRLKHLAVPVVEKLQPDDELPRVDLEHIEGFTGELLGEPDELVGTVGDRVRFRPGDVLVSKLRPYLGKSFHATFDGAASSELIVLRPLPGVSSRWLSYTVLSQPFTAHAVATSSGVKMPRTSSEHLVQYPVGLPSADTQQRVADYLDRETQRIDDVLALNSRLSALLDDRWEATLQAHIHGSEAECRPLQRLVKRGKPIIYGIVLPGPNVDEGVPLIKGGDVHGHSLEDGVPNRVAFNIEADKQRSRVARGDLVYAIRGSFGDVDVVPDALDGANITQDVARISPDPSHIETPWLLYALRSPQVHDQAQRVALGATISGVNIGDLRRFVVPVPPLDQQRELAEALRCEEARLAGLKERLTRQGELLRERRQALITAAVTGKLDIGEAA